MPDSTFASIGLSADIVREAETILQKAPAWVVR